MTLMSLCGNGWIPSLLSVWIENSVYARGGQHYPQGANYPAEYNSILMKHTLKYNQCLQDSFKITGRCVWLEMEQNSEG